MTNLVNQELNISPDDKRWEMLYKILLAEYNMQTPQVSLTVREMGKRLALAIGQDDPISSSVVDFYLKKLKKEGYIDFPELASGSEARNAGKILLTQF